MSAVENEKPKGGYERSLLDVAMRRSATSPAHLLVRSHEGSYTACGRSIEDMTVRISAAKVPAEQRCERCFPPGATTNYPQDTCSKCGYPVSLRPDSDKVRIREVRGDGGWDHVDSACPPPIPKRKHVNDERERREGLAARTHRNAVRAARLRGDVL